MTIDEVKQMDSLVIPEAQAIIDEGTPVATTEETTGTTAKRPIPAKKSPTMMMQSCRPPKKMVSRSSAKASARITISCPKKLQPSGILTPSDTRR